ncbi:MAG: hypothetical protein IH614_00780, partial [Desulfuromonadales bacterium]|nr:hypothetical protein [Desulfuromonadales bacterium]
MMGRQPAGDLLVVAETYPLLQAAGLTSLQAVLAFDGGVRICHKRGRSVYRLEIGERAFYLKRNRLHRVEFWKGLSRLRLPRREAQREWENIQAVHAAGIPTVTPVAMGEQTFFGLEAASFLLTEELYGAEPLDLIIRRRFLAAGDPARHREKRQIIRRLATLARQLHGSGMNHQDFYLNHFFLDPHGVLYLLDLQRIQRRPRVPRRYLVKDLGQLNYSALSIGGFSRTDRLRFLLAYLGTERPGGEGR